MLEQIRLTFSERKRNQIELYRIIKSLNESIQTIQYKDEVTQQAANVFIRTLMERALVDDGCDDNLKELELHTLRMVRGGEQSKVRVVFTRRKDDKDTKDEKGEATTQGEEEATTQGRGEDDKDTKDEKGEEATQGGEEKSANDTKGTKDDFYLFGKDMEQFIFHALLSGMAKKNNDDPNE